MAMRQAWAVVAAVALLAAAGCSSQAERAGGPNLQLDLGDGVTMDLVLIPAGKFTMGEGEARHEVTLSRPFYMGVTEVTQAQYRAVTGTNPSRFKGDSNPVETISWDEATEFAKKLARKTRHAARLPTEEEWEYACRAGSEARFGFGGSAESLGDYAWYTRNSGGTTHPVGEKKPNAWGLYDMHGNVFEWCRDYLKGVLTNPPGMKTYGTAVLRGGSWDSSAEGCRATHHTTSSPGFRDSYYGCRVVVPVSVLGF